nr:MAG TPA: hypothetical protein [Caudoviricetes sp.]
MRLINLDALSERLETLAVRYTALGNAKVAEDYKFILRILGNEAAVDAVPVIRCQKCIFYDPANCSNWCSHPKGLCNPGESDFCSYGKERAKPINSAPLNQEERWLKTV